MFMLVSLALLSFLFGFVCPPLWIATFFALRAIVRFGRRNHAEFHEAQEMAYIKTYGAWAK